MLDELRDLFLAALRFDGDDARQLITAWNAEIERLQAVFDNMTDKTVPVVRCKDCRWLKFKSVKNFKDYKG